MSAVLKNKKALYWAITLLLTLAAFFLPLGEAYTLILRKFIAITVFGLCALAFDLMGNFALGLLMPALWVMTGVTSYATAFSPYVSTNFMLLVSAFFFATVLGKTGLLNRIGYALIVKSGGTYASGVWAIFFIGIILSFASMMNACIIICTIALSMAKALDIKPDEKAAIPIFTALVLSICNAKVICYSPISITIMNASVQAVIPDFAVSYFELLIHNLPMFAFMLLYMWGTLKWYERATKNDSYDLAEFKAKNREAYAALGKMSQHEKICSVLLIGIFVWMFLYTVRIIPWDVVYAFIIMDVILFLTQIADDSDVKRVNYGITIVVMAFVAVGSVASELGLTSVISASIGSLFAGMSPQVATFATLIFGTLANFILTPYAMMSMLPMVVATYSSGLGLNILPQLYATYLAADCIFFPYEYPLVLLIFSFGICKMSNVVKILSIKTLLNLIFVAVVMIPFWMVIGLY